jgi:hypothetical protein
LSVDSSRWQPWRSSSHLAWAFLLRPSFTHLGACMMPATCFHPACICLPRLVLCCPVGPTVIDGNWGWWAFLMLATRFWPIQPRGIALPPAMLSRTKLRRSRVRLVRAGPRSLFVCCQWIDCEPRSMRKENSSVQILGFTFMGWLPWFRC